MLGNEILILPGGGPDPDGFHWKAVDALYSRSLKDVNAYSTVLAVLYYFSGDNTLFARILNLILSMNSIYIAYNILYLLNINSKVTEKAIMLMAFMPNFAIMSIVIRRESLIIFLVTLSIYNFSKYQKYTSKKSLVFSYIFVLLASLFHSGLSIILLPYSLYLILYNSKTMKYNFSWKSIITSLGLSMVFIFILSISGDSLLSKFQNFESVEDIFIHTEVANRGGSGYTIEIATGNSTIDFMLNTPIRMFFFYYPHYLGSGVEFQMFYRFYLVE
ncbi:phospholipid carrier-dependent glycosyltransferase [Ruoffia tabacinasalis]|uniref:phospholipid carrier-dependent glycosyltransferase n=1 Tax=Ruoffia tabacinasalis TaxID=87458 RepID=UPI0030D51620